ncbi:5-carboxymethyl-2-hydroxymuconate Delta-isomerase [Streptomyces sp. TLI_171]|uniref:5-carboxymethyl-2-hydroxymuconate Delta-isomerase n=1 Tax=Streptomyces sp. TLI_171 TaxID=1938859 RepID=UPI000C19C7CD|nr:isomerase [Streptomyces sp. TLI_171]RKE23254.1 5-carboxymethyl-2-hydroxymuconate isomerase [Streptomyces sp. TLI_171]
MPQILIDHSPGLDFDATAFAKEVHALIPAVIDTTVGDCKTLVRPAAQHLVGDGSSAEAEAVVLVEIKILAGRSVEARATLSARVTELLRAHVRVPAAFGVEITELDRESYVFVHHGGQ